MPANATSDGGNFLWKWGGPSAWCEGNYFKVGGPGPGNEKFLAELSQSLVILHICLSEADRNAEGVHGKEKVGNPCPTQLF